MKQLQACLHRWAQLVFTVHEHKLTPKVRALRLLEESMELAQAEDITLGELDTIKNQVYSRPKGDPRQEVGGTAVTLLAYCNTRGYDFEGLAWLEFLRIMDPAMMEKVRSRNLDGDKIGIEL